MIISTRNDRLGDQNNCFSSQKDPSGCRNDRFVPLGPCSSNRIQMLRFGAVSNSKSSNGRKIARMVRNSTIFEPNRSRRRELNFEKFSNERANEQTNKTNKKFRKFFEKFFEIFFKKFSKNLVI